MQPQNNVKDIAPDTWIDRLRAAYKAGAFDEEVQGLIPCTPRKFDELYKTDVDFRKMVEIGRVQSKAWWYSLPAKNINDRSFNATAWMFVMKNKYQWGEKGGDALPFEGMNPAELEEAGSKLAKALLKRQGVVFEQPDRELIGGKS